MMTAKHYATIGVEMKWEKISIEATKHRYIVGIFEASNDEGDTAKIIDILYFNGISNRWNSVNGNARDLMMKDIEYYIPIPELDQ